MQYTEKHKEIGQKAAIEHQQREEQFKLEKEGKSKKKLKLIAIVAIISLAIIALISYAILSPGKYDDFAKCLTEKGAIMYGEDWCQYTNAQKGMFGKSFKYINYEQKPGLKIRPTWVINGNTYETVQSFERLSALTSCELNKKKS